MPTFKEVVAIAKLLQTMYSERENVDNEIQQYLEEGFNVIFFLGFGFDNENMEKRLGMPEVFKSRNMHNLRIYSTAINLSPSKINKIILYFRNANIINDAVFVNCNIISYGHE